MVVVGARGVLQPSEDMVGALGDDGYGEKGDQIGRFTKCWHQLWYVTMETSKPDDSPPTRHHKTGWSGRFKLIISPGPTQVIGPQAS